MLDVFWPLWRPVRLAALCFLPVGATLAEEAYTCPEPASSYMDISESKWTEDCPYPKGWRPADDQLQQILSRHSKWIEEAEGLIEVGDPDARANLCNANLYRCRLNSAILDRAQLNGAILVEAELRGASLLRADLRGANLVGAILNEADLTAAALDDANLMSAELNDASFFGATLNDAVLYRSQLNKATFFGATLHRAKLGNASLTGTRLAGADLTEAEYDPSSAGVPDSVVAAIKGLATMTFHAGRETGLIQLRDLLQKAGLRELEREATFSIESGRTTHAIKNWAENPGAAMEGVFRSVAFDWTTGYGLYPGRALKIIVLVWLALIAVYFWPIRREPKRPTAAGIYQLWPSDRIDVDGYAVSVGKSAAITRLQSGTLGAIGQAAYFSLLSAFHIGWRDLNVGTWIARIQPREYALRATGWVRVVSGIQSLLSVYLLAMWALTYFGRPFQ
jgi:uncharacterized protein YjbI with pentapeptide repeats